ncbi:MAG TPA: hypothetical protein VF770_07205 [Solirubrobacterales bacterium]
MHCPARLGASTPASPRMELLGERNWWLPRWLERFVPRVSVEAAPECDEELLRTAA